MTATTIASTRKSPHVSGICMASKVALWEMKRYSTLIFCAVCAAWPLALHAAGQQVQGLVDSLRDDDEVTAQAAERMLTTLGPEAVPPLQKALSDADFRLRRRA